MNTGTLNLDRVPDEELRISLDQRTLEAAREAADRAELTLSAWIVHAIKSTALYENGMAGIREYEAEHGEITDEEVAAAEVELDRLSREAYGEDQT
jgi:hypothetical protein